MMPIVAAGRWQPSMVSFLAAAAGPGLSCEVARGCPGVHWRGSAGPGAAPDACYWPSKRWRRWPSAWVLNRETCIWEMPSCWPICAWVMSS